MAAIITDDPTDLTFFSFPIEKSEDTGTINPVDGTPDLVIYGKATDGTVDGDRQIIDPEWSAKALQEWLDTGGNVRMAHDAKKPVGKGQHVDITPDGHYVRSLICDPAAKHLIRQGVIQDYSVGVSMPDIRYGRDKSLDPDGKAVNGIITGRPDGLSRIAELSVVDRGSNFNTRFQIAKSAADGNCEFIGKMLDQEGDDTVNLTLPKDVSVSFTPADLAKLMAHKRTAEQREALKSAAVPDVEKKDVRPEVGGGVDVDKLPDSDFVFPKERTFPIATPGDVSDAVSSWGRYKGPESFDTFKERLTAMAKRKGDQFVEELPQNWKDENAKKTDDAADATKAGKPAFPGAHPAFGSEHQPPHDEADDAAIARRKKKTKAKKANKAITPAGIAELQAALEHQAAKNPGTMTVLPPVVKGAKACTKCGKSYDADSKMRTCEGCGNKLPKANKASTLAGATVDTINGVDVTGMDPALRKALTELVLKKDKVMCPGCGANIHDKHHFCPECGSSLANATPIDKTTALKNHDYTCLKCGEDLDKGEKYCPNCGKKNPGYLPMADSKVKTAKGEAVKAKKNKPTPGHGAVGDNTQPVPEHREPDGPYIEALEHDAGLPTVDDDTAMKAAMRLNALAVPSDQGALHDLLCPAYHPADVAKAHPYTSTTNIDTSMWQAKALELAVTAPVDQAPQYAQLGQHAVTLKAADLALLDDLRAEAHKAFRDANPGPSTFPTPVALTPQRFNRPYLSAGHAATSPGHDNPHNVAEPPMGLSATDYDRGPLTAGHAADSPGNPPQRPEAISVPAVPGVPQRVYYSNTQKDNARQAMSAMHDHIAQTFPDLCPMHGPGHAGAPAEGARPVPQRVGKTTDVKAEAVKATKAKKTTAKASHAKRRKLERAVLKGDMSVDQARAKLGLKPFKTPETSAPLPEVTAKAAAADTPTPTASFDADILKAAIAEATAPLTAKLDEADKALRKQRKMLNALSGRPDPSITPFRGTLGYEPPAVTKTTAAPAGLPPVSMRAEQAQDAMIRAMFDQWRNDPDPERREVALGYLQKAHGIDMNK